MEHLSGLSSTELEIWADIPGFETYQVSNLGRVKSKEKVWYCGNGAKHIKPEYELKYGSSRGYKNVTLTKDGKRKGFTVHKLVASAFIPNLESKPYIDHINRDLLDNRVENLRWCTARENCANRGGKYERTRN